MQLHFGYEKATSHFNSNVPVFPKQLIPLVFYYYFHNYQKLAKFLFGFIVRVRNFTSKIFTIKT